MDLGVGVGVKGKRTVENTGHRKLEGNTGVKRVKCEWKRGGVG